MELAPGISISLRQIEGDDGAELELSPSASFELLYARRLSFGIEVPALMILPLSSEAAGPARIALADSSLSLGYNFRAGDWRLAADLAYSHPLGVWNDYEATEKKIRSSSGYRRLEAAIAAPRFLDPLAVGMRLSAQTTFPRPERFGSSAWPLDLGISLFATEALNDIVALSVQIENGLSFPTAYDRAWYGSDASYALSSFIGLVLSPGDSNLRIGLAKLLSDPDAMPRLTIAYSYSIHIKGGDKP
ncbi:MAG: hypothetical protein Q8M76_09485 [Spirochaetaceae bacterium]|nr:hypothetical protein [Spirochaetaceae bacterium]